MTQRLRDLRILVVEDEYFIAIQIADVITCHGGLVIGPVAQLNKARDLIRQQTVDGVILDLMLNGQISLSFIDELRRHGTPVIVVTGYARSYLSGRYSDVPHLTKPLPEAALVQLIEDTIRR